MERKIECDDICPICGLKLSFFEGVCFCPAEYCGYKCDKCAKENKK